MKTAVVICPGRGHLYARPNWAIWAVTFPIAALLARFDARRAALGQETLTALDGAQSLFGGAAHARRQCQRR